MWAMWREKNGGTIYRSLPPVKGADPPPKNGSTYRQYLRGNRAACFATNHRLPPGHFRKGSDRIFVFRKGWPLLILDILPLSYTGRVYSTDFESRKRVAPPISSPTEIIALSAPRLIAVALPSPLNPRHPRFPSPNPFLLQSLSR